MGYLEGDPTAPSQQGGSLLDKIMRLRAAQSDAATMEGGTISQGMSAVPVSEGVESSPERGDNWSVKDTTMTTSPGISRKPMRSAVIREFGEGKYKKWDSIDQTWKPVEAFRMKSDAEGVDQMYWWDEGSQMYYPFMINSEI